MSFHETKLITSKDWDAWLNVVKGKSTGYHVWGFVNPALDIRPASLPKPVKPVPLIPDTATAEQESRALTAYKLALAEYKTNLSEWEKQEASFTKLIDFFYASVSKAHTVYFESCEEVHPWDYLRSLKIRLAPSDSARSLTIEKEYHRVKAGPGTRQSAEAWIDDWTHTVARAKDNGLAEASDPKRLYRDFVLAIEKHAPMLSQVCEFSMSNLTDFTAALTLAEEKFRHHIRLHDSKKTGSHSAFATGSTNNAASNTPNAKSSDTKPTYKGKTAEPGECLCGVKHWFSQCDYLRSDRPDRPQGFKPDPQIKRKVDDKLKDKKVKEKVDRALERSRKFEAKSSPSPDSDSGAIGSFCVGDDSFHLLASWIIDPAASYHICNKTMKDRFIKESDAHISNFAIGEGKSTIVAWGKITLNVDTPTGKRIVIFNNVAYIPGFNVNLLSGAKLEDKGIHFVPQHRLLHKDGKTIMFVKRIGDHYVLENNSYPDGVFANTKNTKKTPTKSATTSEWHQLLAHAGNDVIQHLTSAAEGVEVVDSTKTPDMTNCETCVLAKAHRIVSRSQYKAETSDEPFFRITYDLMQLSTALNQEQWVSHIACYEHDFQLVYTHKYKGEATDILRNAIKMIRTRFKYEVVFIRSDGEKSLGTSFRDLIDELGITFEPSAPATSAQNGHSERKGGLLSVKARALRIEAGLPEFLWPWIYQTAGFLMNRTPTRKLSWKTPFEDVIHTKPNLSHLKRFGCKAYPLNKSIPRKDKLVPRAHVGYLVGYDGTNIYNIWIPSQRKVIRTRDVFFHENEFYKAGDIDIAQVEKEPFLQTIEVPGTDTSHLVTELSSDSDEEEEEYNIKSSKANTDSTPQEKEKDQGDGGYPHLPTPTSTDYDTAEESTRSPPKSPSSPPTPLPLTVTTKRQYKKKDPQNKSDFNIENIIEGKRTRGPKKATYEAALVSAANGSTTTYHAAFAAFIPARKFYEADSSSPSIQTQSPQNGRIHRDTLPAEPEFYHQMLKHPHATGFKAAIDVELKALVGKGTWNEVSFNHAEKARRTPIPTRWVFKYKFDDKGYLIKYKARLCARGDLQKTEQDTYTATLAIKILRALMATVAAFDLETRQWDVVNAFANSKIDEPTYIKAPEGWKGNKGVLLLLLRALYGLKQSPAL